MKTNKINNKGFTLIEALVSIALIMTAVMGPLSLTFNALKVIRENRNRVTASYLAEETLENFKNYRDNFALSCSILNINYNYTTQQIDSIYCSSDTNLGDSVPISYYNTSVPPDTNPQSIAWKIFLAAVMEGLDVDSRTNLNLDNVAFYYNPGNLFNNKLASSPSCISLKFIESDGYNCSYGYSTNFKRTVNLTKISANTLKVEVKVIYLEGGTFIQGQRFVSVIDYIYAK